jgi:hypothetical protein
MMMDICQVMLLLGFKILRLDIRYLEKIIVFVIPIFNIKVVINFLKIVDIFLLREGTKKEIHNLIGVIDYSFLKNVRYLKTEEDCQYL